jgi:hypothetical protein
VVVAIARDMAAFSGPSPVRYHCLMNLGFLWEPLSCWRDTQTIR